MFDLNFIEKFKWEQLLHIEGIKGQDEGTGQEQEVCSWIRTAEHKQKFDLTFSKILCNNEM